MKKCPKCRNIYTDSTLEFCLSDGTALNAEPSGEKTEEFPKSNTNKFQDEFENATTVEIFQSKKGSSGRVWKLATFGLLGVLIAVIATLYLVAPEKLRALCSAIPFPDFSSASQESEIDSNKQIKPASKKNDAQTQNPNQKREQETTEKNLKNDTNPESVGIIGKWEISLKTPRRNYPLFWDLEQDENGEITGISNSPFGKEEIKEAKFEDGVLTVKLSRPTGLTFVGNVKGSTIEGNVSTELGPTTFTGKKIEEQKDLIE